MTAYLVDTTILARLANTADAFNTLATHAVLELHRRGEVLHVTPQNLVVKVSSRATWAGQSRPAGAWPQADRARDFGSRHHRPLGGFTKLGTS